MQLLNKTEVLEFFNAPAGKELENWCHENGYHGVNPHDNETGDHVLAAALWYAKSNYPEADSTDIVSFAGLVAYLATGLYGGFGTERYAKERRAENLALSLAGGLPPMPGDIIATVPKEPVISTPTLLSFLIKFYFESEEGAVLDILAEVDEVIAARIILSLAQTQSQYQQLLVVADRFLKKKETIGTLRQTVKNLTK